MRQLPRTCNYCQKGYHLFVRKKCKNGNWPDQIPRPEPSDAEKVLDLSKRSVSLILSELVHEGAISRTGRGIYSFADNPIPLVSVETLADDSKDLYRALESAGIESLGCQYHIQT